MPKFTKGKTKTGGRGKGTPNKKTVLKRALVALGVGKLEDLDDHLLNMMKKLIVLANGEKDEDKMFEKLNTALKTITPYRIPQKKFIEAGEEPVKRLLVIHKTVDTINDIESGEVVEENKLKLVK